MKLEDIRREYGARQLNRKDLQDNPIQQLQLWLQEAAQVEQQDATAMVLATVNSQGQPSQRTVLLKRLDENGLVFYTNLTSQKAQDIAVNCHVSAHFYWSSLERQIKIQGTASAISRAESLAYFIRRPLGSQLAAWSSPQSKTIDSRSFLQSQFEKMKVKFSQGKVPLPDFWGGYRIAPSCIEFWQGGAQRLHDRFRYQIEDKHWVIQRLAP